MADVQRCSSPLRSAARIGVCAAAIMCGVNALEAQTASQIVRFSVVLAPHTAMSAPSPAFSTPLARSAREATRASVAGSSYAISTNESNQKIAASLDAPMPGGVSLAASLTPPIGAWSTGATPLGDTARDVVGGISRTSTNALPLDYMLSGRVDMPRLAPKRVVTFTITGGV